MTYGERISKVTVEQRKELMTRIEKIIGTKKQAMDAGEDLTERIQNGKRTSNLQRSSWRTVTRHLR